MRINNNLMAMNTHRQLGLSNAAGAKSMSKLSSGYRINGAADDAAGLAISEKMRGQIRGLNQASRNSQDAISLIQTAEGALNETHSILQRMRELAVQSATDTNTAADRGEIQKEVDQLAEEITRIAENTEFNTRNLLGGGFGIQNAGTGTLDTSVVGLANMTDINVSGGAANTTYTITEAAGSITLTNTTDGSAAQTLNKTGVAAGDTLNFDALGISIKTDANYAAGGTAFDGLTIITGAADGATFQIGANEGQDISLSISDMTAVGLSVDSIDVSTQTGASASITTINTALETVSAERSKLGAVQNRLDHTIKNLDTSSENLQASESRIRDVDMAKEMMEFTKNNILQQAAQAMLAQANQAPQGVLQLLR
jgi:flagellin